MFNRKHKELLINKDTNIKLIFVEKESPFYSSLYLYNNNNEKISDCSFEPGEKSLIKESIKSYDSLINALKIIHQDTKNEHVKQFINLIESYRNLPNKGPTLTKQE